MTSELPEMRASDAERERIAETLREAVAEGRLTMEEFEQRLDAAYKARTHGELQPLVRDLPVSGTVVDTGSAAGSAQPEERDWAARVGGTATSRTGVGVMGGFVRRGNWTVPRRFTAFTFWGGGEIDLREARFEDRDVEIRCFAVMGGVNVIAPPEIEVQVGGIGIMGGFDHGSAGGGTPGAPRVRITGLAFWGGVGLSRKAREEREEHRLERERRDEERRLEGERRKSLE
ncbi:DUF1707 domain-containing protein [Streptomyces gamaensis]|uniref:DUF1707 domain-containing protein n=1 Tax=Streptomyces gamaensis TaxID=1763542 RepID=A0ABW0Z6Y2_9ACTN